MTRIMYDALSTEAATIPADAQLVAGYIDAGPHPAAPPWTVAEWSLFPRAVHVTIATQPATNDGLVLDVEAGDATPAEAPGWCERRRAAGVHPTVYCSESAWPDVRAAFAARHVVEPEWWIAGYPGSVGEGNLYTGAVAHQYGGNAAGTWDISTVADLWPGVDTDAPTNTEKADNSMELLVGPCLAGRLAVLVLGDYELQRWVAPKSDCDGFGTPNVAKAEAPSGIGNPVAYGDNAASSWGVALAVLELTKHTAAGGTPDTAAIAAAVAGQLGDTEAAKVVKLLGVKLAA